MDSSSRFPIAGDGVDGEAAGGTTAGRARGRDSLFLMARLTIEGDRVTRDVRVRNLSEGGLMVELARSVAVGAAVMLELRGIGEVTGRVAWQAEGRIGVAFDEPIDPMLARKPVGKGPGTPFYAKPFLG